jgi:3-hydroxyacyl-CoA dehydrogenase
MLLEATRVLEENKVRDPRDIDLGVLFGLGFPAAQGGLLWWADCLGAARIIEMLRPLQRLGQRAQPTALLRNMARRAGHFYG